MKFLVMLMTAFVAQAAAGTAFAQEVTGEAHVTLQNAEYVGVEVNGTAWENIEFEKNGKLLIIKGLNVEIERNAVVLKPREDGLAPFELDIPQKSYKKQRSGRIFLLVSKHTVKFEKVDTTTPAPDKDKPGKPEPVTPPTPDTDDL